MIEPILIFIMSVFWIILIYYSFLTVAGVFERYKPNATNKTKLDIYPSVAILIPCHNEGVVIEDTLKAMIKLEYPGKLDIYALNDNSSDDTGEIIESFSSIFKNIHNISVPKGYPSGKSRVLNYGLSISESEYFLVYDADNQPEKDAVTELVHTAETTKGSCGAVGIVKTINAKTNFLTRMIAIEFQVFQLIMQSGRWRVFKAGSLAGTNMLLKRSAIEQLGGYDPYALAEDAELTMRLTAKSYTIPVTHKAITWEQEPENFKVYMKQRTRWMLGNIYLLEKSLVTFKFWKGRTLVHTIQHIVTYLLFFILLLVSNIFMVLSLFGLAPAEFFAPLLLFWYMAYMSYTLQILSAQQVEKTISVSNLCVGFIMYFTYAQLFIVLLVKSFFIYIVSRIRKKTIGWDKTTRVKMGDTK